MFKFFFFALIYTLSGHLGICVFLFLNTYTAP